MIVKNSSLSVDTEKLRKKILDLAMRGKLIPQDSQDEPASVLLEKIKEEKAQLIKEKKIKKSKPLPEITEEEKPFEIPESWEWVRLGEVGVWGAGATPSRKKDAYYTNGTIPWLKTGDLNDGIIKYTEEKITKKALEETSVKLNDKGNVLIAMYGATIGKLGIADYELTTNQACCGCKPFIYNWFLFYYLLKSRDRLIKMGAGGAQPNISKQKIESFLCPLPPLAEQKHIVAKVEECMQVIKTIEDSSKEYEKLENQLDKKVLDLAMRGKLLPQDSQDEPASVLLEKIKEEKAQLIKEKKIKKSKPLPEITDEEKPFEIPESWEWVRLGENIQIDRGGSPRPIKSYLTDDENGINWIKIGDTKENSKYITSTKEKIIPEGLKKTRLVNKGDFLLSNSMSFGRPYILKIDGAIHDGWLVISDFVSMLDNDFLYYLLSSKVIKDQFARLATGSTVKNLNKDRVSRVIIPLPPLAEQKRIVAKIEEIKQYLEI